MPVLPRRVLATWLALPLTAAPLAAQSYAASSAPISNEEIYVAAFKRNATLWCSAGGDDAAASAHGITKKVAEQSLTAAERQPVMRALDSAYAEVARAGGCRAIARPVTLVVVDGFHGHKWDTPRLDIAPVTASEAGSAAETVSRAVELGTTPLDRIPALADFTFDEADRLVAGRYRVPASDAGFEARWVQLEGMVLERYPALKALRQRPSPAPRGARQVAYAASDASPFASWRTSFRNADTRVMEVEMYVTRGRQAELVIVIDHRGYFQR